MSHQTPPFRMPASDERGHLPPSGEAQTSLQRQLYRDLIGVIRLAQLIALLLTLAFLFLPRICSAEAGATKAAKSMLQSIQLDGAWRGPLEARPLDLLQEPFADGKRRLVEFLAEITTEREPVPNQQAQQEGDKWHRRVLQDIDQGSQIWAHLVWLFLWFVAGFLIGSDALGSLRNRRKNARAARHESGYARPSLFAWLAAMALAFVLGSAHQLDNLPDMAAEHDQARALDDALRVDDMQKRYERAAQLQCSQEHGPQALAVFAADGSMRCVTRRGAHALKVAAQ